MRKNTDKHMVLRTISRKNLDRIRGGVAIGGLNVHNCIKKNPDGTTEYCDKLLVSPGVQTGLAVVIKKETVAP